MRERDASRHQAWEGFDGQEMIYDEKKEKRHEASIWFYLMGFSLIILGIIMYNHISEIITIHNGTCIEAKFSVMGNGSEVATYYDADGRPHFYDVSGMNAEHDGTTIKLYYRDNINDALPKSAWYERIWHYSFFGVIFGISLWRILKLYRKKLSQS